MISIKDWNQFQHFKDRQPKWIKLYRDILDDPDWHSLDGNDAKRLVMLWLIASEDHGNLPDVRKLAFRLRMKENDVIQLLNRLSHWLYQDDINLISSRYQPDITEERREREEREKEEEREEREKFDRDFGLFWSEWPNKVGKPDAVKSFKAAIKKATIGEIMDGLREYIRCKPTDRPWLNPATFLNQERWNDRPAKIGDKNDRQNSLLAAIDRSNAETRRRIEELETKGPNRELSESDIFCLPAGPIRQS